MNLAATSLPTSFRAMRHHERAGQVSTRLETLTLNDLSPGEVTIRVAHASVNYKDALCAAGRNRIIRHYPRVGGIDFTGVVLASSDARFKAGDPVVVHGFGVGVDHDGGYSQLARVPADWVLPLPKGMSLAQAAAIGVAGYTAALSIHWMEHNGMTPEAGPVLVTGATGGSGSVAVNMLAGRGYRVVAMTRKHNEATFLRELGATEVIDAVVMSNANRPLETARWAGAIDTVGGPTLGWLTRTMATDGVIAAFGNAGGMDLNTNVLPFILRGVRLLGINANSPMPLRARVWDRVASDLKPARLTQLTRVITMQDLPAAFEQLLAGQAHGRLVVNLAD